MLILIADDEPGIRNTLSEFLKDSHEVLTAPDGQAALEALEKTSIDLVITDQQMPRLAGLDLIRKGKQVSPGTAFLMMTAHGSIEQAVEAIRLGAEDYFMKPIEFDELTHRLSRIEELRSWRAEAVARNDGKPEGGRLIGKSPAMARAREFVKKVADVPSPVLLLGPSGSGKEVLARSIHEGGGRASRPFIAVNCASLTEQLLESELFGHEKGAFTGATAAKPGKFELAKGGTIFLDEVGELSPGIQARLLRVLQEKEFFRVGGTRQIKSDARVITATHRPLKEMIKSGGFREDLFFRLNVLTFELPPLSARPEDLPLLIDFFWTRTCRELCREVRLSEAALGCIRRYPFPGNVRELQNLLERLIVLGPEGGEVTPELLPPEAQSFEFVPTAQAVGGGSVNPTGEGMEAQLDRLELALLSEAMAATSGNQVRAAERLRITRGALQYKLKKHGLLEAEAKTKKSA